MSVVALERCDTLKIDGFAYKTWECEACKELERRLVFNRLIGPAASKPLQQEPPPALPHNVKQPQSASDALAWRSKLQASRHLPRR
jgi:hypothetical protein